MEDDPDYVLLETEVLEDGGRFACETARTAGEARTRGFEGYDAIVLDYNLPDADGLDVLREAVAACETPVVMLTGQNVIETAVEAIRAGAFSYLVKTAENLEVLPEIVGQAVEEATRRRERREMAAQIQRAESLAGLGTLAAGLCHEMNNPLVGILGYVDLYRGGLERDVDKCMDVISRSAERLRDVVSALAAFAFAEALPMDGLDLAALVRSSLEEQGAVFHEANVAVVVETPDAPVAVRGSWPAIVQVIRQLVRNAWQAMEGSKERRLTVRVSGTEGCGRIEVEDTGPGVPAEIEGRIFEPFFTTRDPGQGMGMGLAIAHRIVDEHNGQIRCERGSTGGARFVVELPLADASHLGQVAPPSKEAGADA